MNSNPDPRSGNKPSIVIETSYGVIRAELFQDRAPVTVANLLRYIEKKAYDGGAFFRTVRADNQPNDAIKIGVIQTSANDYYQKNTFAPIALESTNVTGIHHLDGTLSMARGAPDSATASFFICIGDQPSLDFGGLRNSDGQGFAAFGRVIEGLTVAQAIQRAKVGIDQQLSPPIEIASISLYE